MHDLLRPQVRKHVDKLGREKTDELDVKFPSLLDQLSQVRVHTVLKDEVYISFILGVVKELDDGRMVHIVKQVLLSVNVTFSAEVHDLPLIDFFDGDRPLCCILYRKNDFAIGTLTQDLTHCKVIERCGARGCL